VVPRLPPAFLNPFSELPTLDIMCGFYDVEGNPLASSPQQILRKAQQALEDETGCRLEALGELEYYLFSPVEELFPVEPQRGYHEAGPFSKWEAVRVESLAHLTRMGCSVKYAHAEVGNFIADGLQMVQQEIEFLPTDVTRAADEMTLAKWVVRKVAHAHGIEVSFSPKIVVGQAGSGMHFHTRLMRDGVNQFSQGAGLTDVARRVVGGYLSHAASLTAFGNPVPTSFLRLVPHGAGRGDRPLVEVAVAGGDDRGGGEPGEHVHDGGPDLPGHRRAVVLQPRGVQDEPLGCAGVTVRPQRGDEASGRMPVDDQGQAAAVLLVDEVGAGVDLLVVGGEVADEPESLPLAQGPPILAQVDGVEPPAGR